MFSTHYSSDRRWSGCSQKPRLHGDSDPDPNPDWLRLHGIEIQTQTTSLIILDCDTDSNLDSGPGARVNAAKDL